MIEHWLDEQGRQAIERMGWPEWKDANGIPRQLQTAPARPGWAVWKRYKDSTRDFYGPRTTAPIIARALLRDHERKWLEERGYFLSPVTSLSNDAITDYALYDYAGNVKRLGTTDYDAACVAAVLAVGGE